MLSAVSSLLEAIKTIAYFSIYLSYNTGKLIVYGVLFSYETFTGLLALLWSFLVVLNEDLFVFLADLSNRLCCIVGALQNLTIYIADLCTSFVYLLKYIYFETLEIISNIFYGILYVITKSVTSVTSLISGIKYMIVLFGSGVWFVVTLLPVFIVYMYFLITYYAGRAMEEIKTISYTIIHEIVALLTDGVNFFIDVPVEAAAGLLICMCLGYCLVKFQVALYTTLHRIIRFLWSGVCEKIVWLRSVVMSRPSPTGNVEDSSSDSSLDSDDSGNTEDILGPPDGVELVNNDPGWITKRERYRQILQEESSQNCIICMEKSKCILMMPCRHLSTCKECTEKLQRYQQNCPICRRYIGFTIHVY